MNETFYMDQSIKPPHPNNCPPGHLISIAHGGQGHWDGDGCCNASPTASISFIIPFFVDYCYFNNNFFNKETRK